MWYNNVMKKCLSIIGKILGIIPIFLFYIASVVLRLVFMVIVPTKVVGKENLKAVKKKGAIIACNHYSNMDIVYLVPRFFKIQHTRKLLCKKEIGKCWFVRWFFESVGTIFIDRGAVDRNAFRQVDKALKANKNLVMFPEGTRNKSGTDEMNQIKSGVIFFAKKADAYIVPLRFEHKIKMFHKNIIKVGAPYKVGEDGKLKTEEEVKKLEQKFEELK